MVDSEEVACMDPGGDEGRLQATADCVQSNAGWHYEADGVDVDACEGVDDDHRPL